MMADNFTEEYIKLCRGSGYSYRELKNFLRSEDKTDYSYSDNYPDPTIAAVVTFTILAIVSLILVFGGAFVILVIIRFLTG